MPTWTPDPARFPRFALLDGPSPLASLARLSAVLGGRTELWIKREDLLPLAFGGNKLRNLEYLVGAALAEGADCLVTSGRRWSNHARLTAAAGARAGLEVHLVLSGPPADPPNPGVVLDELLGATVHQAVTDDRMERAALMERVVGELRSAGRHVAVVDIGGSGMTGVLGQVHAAFELADQVAAAGFVPDDLCPAVGDGRHPRRAAGGARARPACRRVVHGIAVTPPGELRPGDRGARRRSSARWAVWLAVDPAEIDLDPGQLGAGYGIPTEAAAEAGRLLARSEGILVDPIYTAKALAGLIERVRSGALDGHRVVFWHAGGTPGLFEPLPGPER